MVVPRGAVRAEDQAVGGADQRQAGDTPHRALGGGVKGQRSEGGDRVDVAAVSDRCLNEGGGVLRC